jgi:hypothetical protein
MDSQELNSIISDKYPDICFKIGEEYRLPNGYTYVVKRIINYPPIIYFNITSGPNASTVEHCFPLEMAAKIQHNYKK